MKELTTKSSNELNKLAKDITDKAIGAVNHVVKAKIQIGKKLIKAKSIIGSDEDFVKWCEEKTPINSRQERSYCMKVAQKFATSELMIEAVPYSVLRELTTAPDSLVEAVALSVSSGEKPPTTKEARQMVRDSKPTHRVTATKKQEPSHLDMPDIGRMLSKPTAGRMQYAAQYKARFQNKAGWAYLIFGLDPEPKHMPSPQAVSYIYSGMREAAVGNTSMLDTLSAAIVAIETDIAESYQ